MNQQMQPPPREYHFWVAIALLGIEKSTGLDDVIRRNWEVLGYGE